jgi:hypothetical protein
MDPALPKKCNEELFKASKFNSSGGFPILIHLVTLNICNEVRNPVFARRVAILVTLIREGRMDDALIRIMLLRDADNCAFNEGRAKGSQEQTNY